MERKKQGPKQQTRKKQVGIKEIKTEMKNEFKERSK